MYIVSLTYKASLEAIDKELNNHIAFLKEQSTQRHFMASGRKVPRIGGIIFATIKNKEELSEILKQDPFNKNNLADYEITEFIPTMTNENLKCLLGK